MPTPAERQALLFVAVLAALGVGARSVRVLRTAQPVLDDRAALATQIARVDSAIASGGRNRVARNGATRPPVARAPSARASAPRVTVDGSAARHATVSPGAVNATDTGRLDPLETLRLAPIDLDRADSTELDRLPGIGPALAARILADRGAHGPFGSLADFQRVRGVGPALSARVAPYVTFSTPPRPTEAKTPSRRHARRP